MSEIKSLYRWGSWKTSESEFAGIRRRQQREFSITVDLEDCTKKIITEAPQQESLNCSRAEHVARCAQDTASWRAQQMSPQFAADVSLLLSATAQPVVHSARSSGRQQVGPRHASQYCTGSSRSLFL